MTDTAKLLADVLSRLLIDAPSTEVLQIIGRDDGGARTHPIRTTDLAIIQARAALAQYDAQAGEAGGKGDAGYVLVPRSALEWLNGEGDDFECPPENYFRGKPPTYWWRSEFRKRIAAAPCVTKK